MLGRKASDAAAAAQAFANTSARRIAETFANAASAANQAANNAGSRRSSPRRDKDGRDDKDKKSKKRSSGRSGGSENDIEEEESERRCATDGSTPFGFLDNVCGPMFGAGKGINDDDDTTVANPNEDGRRGGRRGRRSGSFDYDDETNITDVTGSYDDDETYGDDRKKSIGGGSGRRGRDRKPRARSPIDSPSEMTGMTGQSSSYAGFDDKEDDTDTEFSGHYDKKDKAKSKSVKSSSEDDGTATTATGLVSDPEKLITQPLASGFAKRCYFTKAGIGRTTQHYEGLTLTGNTVLMLAAAMKLKGCPTICDEDLRRVEQTYPNQFSRLPDELLLSSGWRRISKYCHFSHKPLPDGVPFFHSRKRCHPNGGFYFLLCSAVGMTRLMDVEPLNKDALAVLQTDFPIPCDKAPKSLMEDPEEWTLVNKFCFFSGGPINVDEDVYYRAELGGTEIYMLAFLSPSLSPEELYRLNGKKGAQGEKSGEGKQTEEAPPLKSIVAVEEVESVYDLTERDFDDLKLYHLGPCRALPPYLLHPEAWTKVLPPHFLAAREEAMMRAREWESRYPSASSLKADNATSGYVELGMGTPAARGGSMGMQAMSPGGQGFPPQYPGHGIPGQSGQHPQHGHNSQSAQPSPHDPSGFHPPGAYPPQQHQSSFGGVLMDNDLNNYYYSGGNNAITPQSALPGPGPYPLHQQHQPHLQHQQQIPGSPNLYHNQSANASSPGRIGLRASPMNPAGSTYNASRTPHNHMYNSSPQPMMNDSPHWKDIQEEGAFGISPGGDQPDDEAIATRGRMYDPNGMMHPHEMNKMHEMMDPLDLSDQFLPINPMKHMEDPPDNDTPHMPNGRIHGNDRRNEMMENENDKSVMSECSGTSSVMRGAQEVLKRNRLKRIQEKSQRPDLATKLGKNENNHQQLLQGADDSTWDTRTEGESSYGTSLVSGSSIYTDTTNPNERNSRRALILQMAKARMKNVKQASTDEKMEQATDQGLDGDSRLADSEFDQGDLAEDVGGLELD